MLESAGLQHSSMKKPSALAANGVLSGDIPEELAYDTDADTRKLARSIKPPRKSEAISK